jgi:hypothetical protein
MNRHTRSSASPGKLLIRDKDNATYTLMGPPPGSGQSIDYVLTEPDSPCPNDVARFFQVTEFPSATRIFMCDNTYFSDDKEQSFYMEVVTTRKRTSVEAIELEYVPSYTPDEIMEPGVQLVRIFRKGSEQIRDRLSFVRITASTDAPDPNP